MSVRTGQRRLAAPWKAKGPLVGAVSYRCLFGTDRCGEGRLLHFVYLHQPFDGLSFGGLGSDLLGAGLGSVGGLGLSFLHRV